MIQYNVEDFLFKNLNYTKTKHTTPGTAIIIFFKKLFKIRNHQQYHHHHQKLI